MAANRGDASDHRRAPATSRIRPDQLKIDPSFNIDPMFLDLVMREEKGTVAIALTRLSSHFITAGFYRRDGDATVHVDNPDPRGAAIIASMIKAGDRPAVSLYWNALAPKEPRWCAPETAVLEAYRTLGIGLVPCRILKPRKDKLPEAAIWLKRGGDAADYDCAKSPDIQAYAQYSGLEECEIGEAFSVLRLECQRTLDAITVFHRPSEGGLHYHQMLHAIVRRHARALDTIAGLIDGGRAEHAAAIARLAYEAFLNFYVDWLAPTFFGPRLQALSVLRTTQASGAKLSRRTSASLQTIESNLGGFLPFLENAARKAAISPLGDLFHDIAYPPLSSIMHQTYGHVESEAIGFADTPSDNEKPMAESLLRWMNVITTALLSRVRDDVGAQPAPL